MTGGMASLVHQHYGTETYTWVNPAIMWSIFWPENGLGRLVGFFQRVHSEDDLRRLFPCRGLIRSTCNYTYMSGGNILGGNTRGMSGENVRGKCPREISGGNVGGNVRGEMSGGNVRIPMNETLNESSVRKLG